MPKHRITGVWAIFASIGITMLSAFINYFDIQNSVWNNINLTLYSFFSYLGWTSFPTNLLPSAYGNLQWAITYAIFFALFTFSISFSVALEAYNYRSRGKW